MARKVPAQAHRGGRIDDTARFRRQRPARWRLRGNIAGLKACRAALTLSKRGVSVTQGFIFLARGGCGLSLFTSLLTTSLGDELHKYFDPYLFYDDEELRKTVELLMDGIDERSEGSSATS